MNIELHNYQNVGDVLCSTGAIQTYGRLGHRFIMRDKFPMVWHGNPYVGFDGLPDKVVIMRYGRKDIHMIASYAECLGKVLGYVDPLERPYLYDVGERTIDGPYVLCCNGWKNDLPCKRWDHWQGVVDALVDRGVHVVQVGSYGTHTRLHGAVDMVGRTTLRQVISLAAHSVMGMGHESMLNHLYGALQLPFVVVASNRIPAVCFSYPNMRLVMGQMDMIPVESVLAQVESVLSAIETLGVV